MNVLLHEGGFFESLHEVFVLKHIVVDVEKKLREIERRKRGVQRVSAQLTVSKVVAKVRSLPSNSFTALLRFIF
jgi:hypothetical protein